MRNQVSEKPGAMMAVEQDEQGHLKKLQQRCNGFALLIDVGRLMGDPIYCPIYCPIYYLSPHDPKNQEGNNMAFVNEYISDEDIEKYEIEKIWLRYNPVYKGQKRPSGFRFQWTIDRERNIYFMIVGGGGYERVNTSVCVLSMQGKQIEVELSYADGGSEKFSDSPFYIVWELHNITSHDQVSLPVLKEALTAFGCDGVRRQIPNTIVKFKF